MEFYIEVHPDYPTLYLAEIYGGEWEDAWTHTLMGSTDKEVTEKFIEEHTAKVAAWETQGEAYDAEIEKWMNRYEEKQPAPQDIALYYAWYEKIRVPLEQYKSLIAKRMELDLTCDRREEGECGYRIQEVSFMQQMDSFGR